MYLQHAVTRRAGKGWQTAADGAREAAELAAVVVAVDAGAFPAPLVAAPPAPVKTSDAMHCTQCGTSATFPWPHSPNQRPSPFTVATADTQGPSSRSADTQGLACAGTGSRHLGGHGCATADSNSKCCARGRPKRGR